MADGPLPVVVSRGVARVTIDHPPTNLVDGVFLKGLLEFLDRFENDDEVRVAVFASADPDFFLMHGDVRGILSMPTGSYVPAVAAQCGGGRLRASAHESPGLHRGD